MKISVKDAVASTDIVYSCGRCTMQYKDYKILVQHLFWRHGTDSYRCNKCLLKRWQYAAHICHVLPVDAVEFQEEEYEDVSHSSPHYQSYGKKRLSSEKLPPAKRRRVAIKKLVQEEAPFKEEQTIIKEQPLQATRESEFCSCGSYIAESKMIGCDAKDCPYQWYHYECVGIVNPPDGEWLCPFCTKLKTIQIMQSSTKDARKPLKRCFFSKLRDNLVS